MKHKWVIRHVKPDTAHWHWWVSHPSTFTFEVFRSWQDAIDYVNARIMHSEPS